jgi:hypothetical protein
MTVLAYDRIKDTTTTTGTGNITLANSPPDSTYFTFGSVFSDGNELPYVIINGTTQVEWGVGTYVASGTQIARTTVLGGSNGTSAVSLTSGTKTVFCGPLAELTPILSSGNLFSMSSISWNDWIKAANITPQSDNTALSTWNDISGNSYNYTQSGSNRPKYRTGANTQLGVPGIQFSSASSEYMSTSSGGATYTTSDWYNACVISLPGAISFMNIWSAGNNTFQHERRSIALNPFGGDGGYLAFIGQNSDVNNSAGPLLFLNEFGFCEWQYVSSTNTITMWLNGIQVDQRMVSALQTYSQTAMYIGANPSPGEYADMVLYEKFGIGRVLTTTEQANVRLAMASEYSGYINNITGNFIQEYNQAGQPLNSPMSDVGGILVTAGSMVVGGQLQQYSGGNVNAIFSNVAALSVNGPFVAACSGTQEHMFIVNGSINGLAVWNQANSYVATRYLHYSGYEAAVYGYDPSVLVLEWDGTGGAYIESSNFYNTANGGCFVFLQTGQIAGGSNGQYKRHEWRANGNAYWYGLSVGSRTPPIILELDINGNLVVGKTSALATSATDGFLYVSNCAGTPTGTPTTFTGSTPVIYDITNNVLDAYSSSWISIGSYKARNTSNASNATATMSNLSDLTINLAAGMKYFGTLTLFANNSTAAEGLQFDFNGGSATMTSFEAGFSAQPIGVTLGTLTSTSLSTALTATTATTADSVYTIEFTMVVNAAGTFIPRYAEVSHTLGTATVKLGSNIIIQQSPN